MFCATGPAQVEARRNTHYDHVNGAMAGYFYGRHLIKVKLIQSPEEQYRARVAKQENVDALEKSLQQYGTVNEHVELVLFVAGGKQLPAKVGFVPLASVEELAKRGFEGYFTVVGDHTQRAMNQLHRKFGNNPKWAELEAKLFVVQRTDAVYRVLKSWGILDNMKAEKRVNVSFHDKIASLHEDYLHLKANAHVPGHKDQGPANRGQGSRSV